MNKRTFQSPPEEIDQSYYLSVLSRAPAHEVKGFVDRLIPELGPIEVIQNRTALVMASMQDTAQGTTFFLGEVLVAEAHVRLGPAEGYAACLGRDLQQALAIALIDAAIGAGIAGEQIAPFISAQAAALDADDQRLLEAVEATRVEMETF
ncbi:MAG TPA: phosphonate C-P lyase system protein PhnG [Roseiflexaceae bacterium]|nr:phosphonate C-P lyase system protein PhnG [Roseiflexaceae bacterium]